MTDSEETVGLPAGRKSKYSIDIILIEGESIHVEWEDLSQEYLPTFWRDHFVTQNYVMYKKDGAMRYHPWHQIKYVSLYEGSIEEKK